MTTLGPTIYAHGRPIYADGATDGEDGHANAAAEVADGTHTPGAIDTEEAIAGVALAAGHPYALTLDLAALAAGDVLEARIANAPGVPLAERTFTGPMSQRYQHVGPVVMPSGPAVAPAVATLKARARMGATITSAAGVATVVTARPHGFGVGDTVAVKGADQDEYNGSVAVLAVPDAVTFTYAVAGGPASPATGDIVVGALPAVPWRLRQLDAV